MNDPAAPLEPQKELDFLRPAIAGGLFLGILSTVPIFTVGCCLWLLAGGGLAAFLVDKQRPGGLKLGDGALAGVLSGVAGTVVSTLISIPLQTVIYTPATVAQMRELYTQLAKDLNLPADFMKSMEPMLTIGFSSTRLVAWAVVFSILSGLLAMIGGILTVAILKRRRQKH